MGLPDFVIIGAMKCGTSTLQAQLSAQPGIFMCEPKEPNFFSDDEIWSRGVSWYESLFRDAQAGSLMGEASTHYTKLPHHPMTVDRMRRHLPDARLIYMVRDPFARMVSHYLHAWSQGEAGADFDAAVIRHQLYTLTLTHFAEVYRNYFERPKLHTLHNRSGELWSPLVALAAFFEERGSLSGLLDAISRAAEWDEQVSEGKALSDREEAVLQALEMMTRGTSEISWLKASALREEVARLMGQPTDRMGDAQWIGHILKRLHLLDDGRRKRSPEGMTYAIHPGEARDMMRRYDVVPIENASG